MNAIGTVLVLVILGDLVALLILPATHEVAEVRPPRDGVDGLI
jgi:hypothetical protein